MKKIESVLILVGGLLLGLLLHGLIEIPAIFLLTGVFENLFLNFNWQTWVLIHHIFSIIIGILGVILAFRIYKKVK